MSLKRIVGSISLIGLMASPLIAQAGFADSSAKTTGFSITAVAPSFLGIKSSGGLINTILNIINSLLLVAAIVAVVFLILGGVRYITSQGDPDVAKTAKLTIIYALIGVLVILLSVVLITFFSTQIGA